MKVSICYSPAFAGASLKGKPSCKVFASTSRYSPAFAGASLKENTFAFGSQQLLKLFPRICGGFIEGFASPEPFIKRMEVIPPHLRGLHWRFSEKSISCCNFSRYSPAFAGASLKGLLHDLVLYLDFRHFTQKTLIF